MKWTPEGEQARYREVFERADGLVLTVGLAEVWEDKESGGVFWRVKYRICTTGRASRS